MQALLTAALTVAFITTSVILVRWHTNTRLTHTQLLLRHGKRLAGLYLLAFVLFLALFRMYWTLAGIAPIAVAVMISVPTAMALRIKNAQMSEMQLFKKYWPVWIALVILILAAGGWSIVMVFRLFLQRIATS